MEPLDYSTSLSAEIVSDRQGEEDSCSFCVVSNMVGTHHLEVSGWVGGCQDILRFRCRIHYHCILC